MIFRNERWLKTWITILLLACMGCKPEPPPPTPDLLQLISVKVGTLALQVDQLVEQAPVDQPIVMRFAQALETSLVPGQIVLQDESGQSVPLAFSFLDQDQSVSARPEGGLQENHVYELLLQEGIMSHSGAAFPGARFRFSTLKPPLLLESVQVDGINLDTTGRITDISLDFQLELQFSHAVNSSELEQALSLRRGGNLLNFTVESQAEPGAFKISLNQRAVHMQPHSLGISESLQSEEGHQFDGFSKPFYTRLDTTPKFPLLSDDDLLTLVQQQTFRYFWDFGHPISGLSRERNTSGELVTSGGSGFGLMAMIVGIERGFITRADGVARFATIVDFLAQADRFHGAWSHWLNGSTGAVIPFSAKDNGGDLVETSYLIMGLLTVRQYLDELVPAEAAIRAKIDTLWHGVEWDWYTRGGQNVLYWHWSPQFNWEINLPVRGYNEALITYLLAAASPTHPIDSQVYHQGWARNGGMVNGGSFYGVSLPLGPAFGGPLFFSHYTFLGIDPRNLSDQYADYGQLGINHSLINREHCIRNPNNYVGYSAACWGLTASDNHEGYSAHSPTNDKGVITPTAALSAMPYVPDASMAALKHFYYVLGDRLWGDKGFFDAFNPTEGWVASSFLAIDQGPIIGMIENHRTGLLWNLFMSCPEVQAGLTKLGFTY